MTEKILIKGEIVQTGNFEGNIVYLKNYEDLSQVNDGTLLVLDDCPKSLAVLGMQRARATIKIGGSETSHLVLCAEPDKPFASVNKKEAEKLLNGNYQQVEFIDSQKSALSSSYALPKKDCLIIEQNFSGQKGARLYKLRDLGLIVPRFNVIGFGTLESLLRKTKVHELFSEYLGKIAKLSDEGKIADLALTYVYRIQTNIKESLQGIVTEEIRKFYSELQFPISVRSNFSAEDETKDSMAGVFTSRLNIHEKDLEQTVIEVLSSMFNLETMTKYRDILPSARPSIILQEMVSDPLLSGTFFLHSRTQESMMVFEGKYLDYGASLMDNLSDPDVKVRIPHDMSYLQVDTLEVPDEEKNRTLDTILKFVRQAVELYRLTGWDDIEFSIDREYNINWLQARGLVFAQKGTREEKIESLNISENFFNTIHYRNTEANKIRNTQFTFSDDHETINFDEEIEFGTPSVVFRDVPEIEFIFHKKLKEDLEHMKRITSFGYEVDEEMIRMTQDLSKVQFKDYFLMLTLHAAVRHGSFGFRSRFKPHYSQRFWIGERGKWVDDLIGKVISQAGLTYSVASAVDSLYLPQKRNSSMYEQENIISLLQKMQHGAEISEDDWMTTMISQLHEIPDFVDDKKRDNFYDFLSKAQAGIKSLSIEEASNMLRRMKESYSRRKRVRDDIISAGNRILTGVEKDRFVVLTDFLRMKGEINETHPIYRGLVFMHIGRICKERGISPSNTSRNEMSEKLRVDPHVFDIYNMRPVYENG